MEAGSIITEELQFIDPLSDYGFKKLFNNKDYTEVLISFLNELLLGRKKIIKLSFAGNEHQGGNKGRTLVLDLYCTGEDNEHFIIEMQRVQHDYFRERCVAYTSRIISNQLKKGNQFNYDLQEVIFIGILNFNFKDTIGKGYINEICLRNKHSDEIFYDKLDYFFVELPKFDKVLEDCSSAIDKWIYLFKNLNTMKNIPKMLSTGIFSKVFEIANIKKMTPAERNVYDLSLINQTTEANFKSYYVREGKEEGKVEGRVEEKMQNATQMKIEGISPTIISKITNLTLAEIEGL